MNSKCKCGKILRPGYIKCWRCETPQQAIPLKEIHTLPTTIECHENHISGPGVDYTARAWYVRLPNGKLHGQFMTHREAVSFADVLDN